MIGEPSAADVAAAVGVLRAAGFSLLAPARRIKLLSVAEVAELLSVSGQWVREHLSEFPGAVDLGGATKELRIPESDVLALADRRRVFSAEKP